MADAETATAPVDSGMTMETAGVAMVVGTAIAAETAVVATVAAR